MADGAVTPVPEAATLSAVAPELVKEIFPLYAAAAVGLNCTKTVVAESVPEAGIESVEAKGPPELKE